MPIDIQEQKNRRTLNKLVVAEIRARAKATGWKTSQGWLFREHHGWFIDARAAVWVMERRSTLELRCKPMNIDPLFLEMVETQDNNAQPLSFRLVGAWTVSTPSLSEVEVEERALDAARLADAMMKVAHREFERSQMKLNLYDFYSAVQEAHARSPTRGYFAALVCTLVLLGRREEARGICSSAKERKDSGGFQVGSRTFPDLALEWLTKTETVRH